MKTLFLSILLLFLLTNNFAQSVQWESQDSTIRKQKILIEGESILSKSVKDEFGFLARIIPEQKESHSEDIKVFCSILDPLGREKIFQLDYIHQMTKKNSILYGCVLCFEEEGNYQVRYFAKNLDGKIFWDKNLFEFEVYPLPDKVDIEDTNIFPFDE